MNIMVVYQSGTGFTKQYAEWIGEELGCETKSVKEVTAQDAASREVIIYGGWIMANTIAGLDKIKDMSPKKLVVFAVGAGKGSQALQDTIREINHIGEIPFFYMQGGFKHEKLGFLKRKMLGMVRKSIAKKEDKTEADRDMEQALSASCDFSSKEQIQPLVQYIDTLSR